jgi:hypothetical protein
MVLQGALQGGFESKQTNVDLCRSPPWTLSDFKK